MTVQSTVVRCFDFCFALFGLILCAPIFIFAYLFIFFESGSPIFVQERVGRFCLPFNLYKFRTMHVGTDSIASHLLDKSAITKCGVFLRRSKLDELPQLFNVLRGDMSLVGPRPCLFNQKELIAQRLARDVFAARPGITGLAQVEGIDMSTPRLLAQIDAQMLRGFNLRKYFIYIFYTVLGEGAGDAVR